MGPVLSLLHRLSSPDFGRRTWSRETVGIRGRLRGVLEPPFKFGT